VGFGRELSVRPSVRLSSRRSLTRLDWARRTSEVRTGVGCGVLSVLRWIIT